MATFESSRLADYFMRDADSTSALLLMIAASLNLFWRAAEVRSLSVW